ncbi:hypothetical protein AB6A40_009353 [Gnathostoma spinigerum]|uniref:Uncharacterized protein n=1 Tax=Gnathostoma spinigerum TaxID=75299 RepID=A0ABD6EWV7_9BILA
MAVVSNDGSGIRRQCFPGEPNTVPPKQRCLPQDTRHPYVTQPASVSTEEQVKFKWNSTGPKSIRTFIDREKAALRPSPRGTVTPCMWTGKRSTQVHVDEMKQIFAEIDVRLKDCRNILHSRPSPHTAYVTRPSDVSSINRVSL